MINIEETIISQYANSPIIIQIIQNMNDYIDPRADINNFYNYVFNIDTAKSFALDIWGRILGVERTLKLPSDDNYFGFANSNRKPFNVAPFYNDGERVTDNYILPDSSYRKLLYLKALSNITQTTAPALNQLISKLFEGRGKCYVQDSGNMTIHYIFEFELTNIEISILASSHIVPKPAGVTVQFDLIANGVYF